MNAAGRLALLLAVVAMPAHGADIEALVLYEHRSNVLRGGCDANGRCRAEQASKVGVRWYPGRSRRGERR